MLLFWYRLVNWVTALTRVGVVDKMPPPQGLGVPVCPLAEGKGEGGEAAALICACIFRQTSVGAVTARRRNALPVFPL